MTDVFRELTNDYLGFEKPIFLLFLFFSFIFYGRVQH